MKTTTKGPRVDEIYLLQGGTFESAGSGLFAKDVAVDGEFFDVKSGRVVSITPDRRRKIAAETNRFLENGNEIPFPDGHTWDAMKNLGDWPGPFIVHDNRLVGVVKPKGDDVVDKLKTGKINRVSMVLSKNHIDPKGNVYEEVIIQCCATPIPVLTGQSDFVALSQDGKAELPVFEQKAPEPKPLKDPTVEELAQGFAPAREASFSELAQIFHKDPEPAPDFAALARGFVLQPKKEEKLAQAPAAPPPPIVATTPQVSQPVTVNLTIADGAFRVEPSPVTINQGDVSLELKPSDKTITIQREKSGERLMTGAKVKADEAKGGGK